MRHQYITDDGKVFENKIEAAKHEQELNADSELQKVNARKKEYAEKVGALTEKINAMQEEIVKLMDERDGLMDKWKSEMSPEQQKAIDTFERIIDRILG